MTATLLELISDMKICLALALGTGLISGYLYTKLRAKEIYKPDIINLKKKIKYNKNESRLLLSKNSDIENEIESFSSKVHEENIVATKHKNELYALEENFRSQEAEYANVKAQYKTKEHMLNRYNKELQELKTTLDVKDISDIENHKSTLHAKSISIVDNYKQKCDSCERMYSEEKSLKIENSELTSKISSFGALFNKKEYELADSTKTVSTIRGKLQLEFDKLLRTKKENDTKIERYKKQLTDIKDKLS